MSIDEIKVAKRNRVIGCKQVNKAIQRGIVQKVFLARDASPNLTQPLLEACQAERIPVEWVEDMATLGKACRIDVGTAAAAILSEQV